MYAMYMYVYILKTQIQMLELYYIRYSICQSSQCYFPTSIVYKKTTTKNSSSICSALIVIYIAHSSYFCLSSFLFINLFIFVYDIRFYFWPIFTQPPCSWNFPLQKLPKLNPNNFLLSQYLILKQKDPIIVSIHYWVLPKNSFFYLYYINITSLILPHDY